jgi:hypothetical protein
VRSRYRATPLPAGATQDAQCSPTCHPIGRARDGAAVSLRTAWRSRSPWWERRGLRRSAVERNGAHGMLNQRDRAPAVDGTAPLARATAWRLAAPFRLARETHPPPESPHRLRRVAVRVSRARPRRPAGRLTRRAALSPNVGRPVLGRCPGGAAQHRGVGLRRDGGPRRWGRRQSGVGAGYSEATVTHASEAGGEPVRLSPRR